MVIYIVLFSHVNFCTESFRSPRFDSVKQIETFSCFVQPEDFSFQSNCHRQSHIEAVVLWIWVTFWHFEWFFRIMVFFLLDFLHYPKHSYVLKNGSEFQHKHILSKIRGFQICSIVIFLKYWKQWLLRFFFNILCF